MDRQELLAADIVRLIANLDGTLDNYLAIQAGRRLDESSRLLNDSAIAWMRTTLDDLVATVVGIECHGLNASARCAPVPE